MQKNYIVVKKRKFRGGRLRRYYYFKGLVFRASYFKGGLVLDQIKGENVILTNLRRFKNRKALERYLYISLIKKPLYWRLIEFFRYLLADDDVKNRSVK